MVLGRALQNGTDDGPQRAKGYGFYSADLVADPATKETTKECPEVVHRDNTAYSKMSCEELFYFSFPFVFVSY